MATMFDTRNRGLARLADYQMTGADAAADTQQAGAARGLMDPRGGPMNPGQGMVMNPGGGGMFPLAQMGARQHLRDSGYDPYRRGRGAAVPDGDMSMYAGDVPDMPYALTGWEQNPTFGGRSATDPRTSMIDWARTALANRRTTGMDQFDAPPMAGLAYDQQQAPLMTNMSQAWDAEGLPGGMDPNLMAGLAGEGYDVSGMFGKDGGLSPSGSYLRAAYDYGIRNGMNPDDARAQSAMAAGLAKAKVDTPKTDNTDRKAFLDYLGNSDNTAANQNYFQEALTGAGYDVTPLTTTDKDGTVSRTPKFDYLYGQYMRGLMSGKPEEEVLAGLKGLTRVEDTPPKTGAELAQRNTSMEAARQRVAGDQTLSGVPETDARWADFKARRAGMVKGTRVDSNGNEVATYSDASGRIPKGRIASGNLSENRLRNKTMQDDPFAGMTREQIQAQYAGGAPALPKQIVPREYAPRSPEQDAVDFVRQYGNTRKGKEVAAHLERLGIRVRPQDERNVMAKMADVNMDDIRANKAAYGQYMRNQAEALVGLQKMRDWLRAGKEPQKLVTKPFDPIVALNSASGIGW